MSIVEHPELHLAFAVFAVLAGLVAPVLVYRQRFGRSPVVLFGAADSVHRRTCFSVAALGLAWGAALATAACSPAFRNSHKGAPIVMVPAAVSWTLAIGGLALLVAAQATMGEAYRIGQDPAKPPAQLCVAGLHRFSRHPIYLGASTCLLGMTLWWPSGFLALCFVAIVVCLHTLALDEERFLHERFVDRFAAYARLVPRFVGLPRRAPLP